MAGQKTNEFFVNFSNPEARGWMTDYVSERIEKWGLDIYHHHLGGGILAELCPDKTSDPADRRGATENHYVSGFYSYWDELLKRSPNLTFGYSVVMGRPFDLEMISRAYPVWLTAFDRLAEDAADMQFFNAGLNYFIPVHAVLACFDSKKEVKPAIGRYWWRSYGASGIQFKDDLFAPSFDVNVVRANISETKMLQPLLLGDYYPLMLYEAQ